MPRYLRNGEPTYENRERDNKMRIERPDLHSQSFDGEICWIFFSIETERNIWTLEELSKIPNLDNAAIGHKRCEYPFIEVFWAYNFRYLNTNRETVKCTISEFLEMGRDFVCNCSLGRYPNWQDSCKNWSVQSDPTRQFCLVPKIWKQNLEHDRLFFPVPFERDENIIGKNLGDDTVCENLDESQFFN
jgi:hypothetical protein